MYVYYDTGFRKEKLLDSEIYWDHIVNNDCHIQKNSVNKILVSYRKNARL